jgi:hypothetical protein
MRAGGGKKEQTAKRKWIIDWKTSRCAGGYKDNFVIAREDGLPQAVANHIEHEDFLYHRGRPVGGHRGRQNRNLKVMPEAQAKDVKVWTEN